MGKLNSLLHPTIKYIDITLDATTSFSYFKILTAPSNKYVVPLYLIDASVRESPAKSIVTYYITPTQSTNANIMHINKGNVTTPFYDNVASVLLPSTTYYAYAYDSSTYSVATLAFTLYYIEI